MRPGLSVIASEEKVAWQLILRKTIEKGHRGVWQRYRAERILGGERDRLGARIVLRASGARQITGPRSGERHTGNQVTHGAGCMAYEQAPLINVQKRRLLTPLCCLTDAHSMRRSAATRRFCTARFSAARSAVMVRF